jgi:drug/metabolite transporter (DMT)-like permease
VFIGLLPLATAVFGVLRGGERPRPVFWLFSILGSALVMGYAVAQGLSAAPAGDVLMLLAVLVCGLGYAEGATLSRSLGGWQVICWALVVALPVTAALSLILAPPSLTGISLPAWLSLGYVAVQHADRLCVLVPRPGPGWHRRRRPVAVAATVFRPGVGGGVAA